MPEKELTFNEKVLNLIFELKAPKGQRNTFGKYNYRSAEDILEAVKPLAHKYGLLPNLTDEVVAIGERVYVKATASLTDGTNKIESTGYAREQTTKKGMDESQITGAASSYARKYAMNGLYQIDDTKDADTNEQREQLNNTPVETISKGDLNTLNALIKSFSESRGQSYQNGANALKKALNTKKDLANLSKEEYGQALHLIKAWQEQANKQNQVEWGKQNG